MKVDFDRILEEEPIVEPVREEPAKRPSKMKSVLLAVVIAGGFGLFAWNMVQLANNLRLENQGTPENTVYSPDDLLDSYLSDSHSQPEPDEETEEPVMELPAEKPVYNSESEAIRAMEKERDEALNDVEFMKRQLKIMEDMLDSSLQREEELKNKQ